MTRVLDMFCGAGGSSYGALRAGAQIAAAVDMWDLATQTFSHNFPDARVMTSRLEGIRPSIFRDRPGRIDLILASPECSNHTCAKGNAPRSEESRATAMQLIRFAADLRPRWIIMENVVHMRPWSGYSKLKSELQLLSYAIREQILDASHFGVPQKRKRLFILADREDTPPIVQPLRQSRSRTVREILDAPGTWRTTPLYQKGRAEDTLARAERAFRTLGKKASFLIVYYGTDGSGGWQSLDKPLRTITTIDRFALVVPSRQGPMMRMLQVSELKRAMGFSSSYALPVGTRREKVRLLGNAVCPPVMQAVVQSLIQPALQRAGR